MERVLSEHQLSLEMAVPSQGLVPKVRSKPRGNKEPGTKVALGRSVLKLSGRQLPGNKNPLIYPKVFSGISGAPEQSKVLERKAL